MDLSSIGPPVKGFSDAKLKVADGREDKKVFDDVLKKKKEDAAEEKMKPPQFSEASVRRKLKAGGHDKVEREDSGTEKVIRKFMDSLESEVGIPPARIVEAMSQLRPQQMVAPASETVDQVVSKLDVSDSEAQKVKAMYGEMIQDLQSLDQRTQGYGESRGFSGIMTTEESLNRAGLKDLSAKGLGEIQPGVTQQAAVQQTANQQVADSGFLESKKLANIQGGIPSGSLMPQGMPESMPVGLQKAVGSGELQNQQSISQAMALRGAENLNPDSFVETQGVKSFGDNIGSESSFDKSELELQEGSAVDGDAKSSIMNLDDQLQRLLSKGESDFDSGAESESGEDKEKNKNFSSSAGDAKGSEFFVNSGAHRSELSQTGKSSQPVTLPLIAQADFGQGHDNEVNIRQIMNQAQYLIKKGGGEVKVQMNPDGLGQVQLRVALHEGKVSLALKTENEEVKKIIEKNLPDLRTGLSAHKISVENVKVDVASLGAGAESNNHSPSSNSQSSQQFQSGEGRDQSSRQFWQQFRQNFGSSQQQRGGVFDIPNLKGYGSKKTTGLQPLEGPKRTPGGRENGSSTGLDLVV